MKFNMEEIMRNQLKSETSPYLLQHAENPMPHITIAPKKRSDLNQIREKLPFMANVSLATDNTKYPLLNNQTTFYVCKNHNCLPSTNAIETLC